MQAEHVDGAHLSWACLDVYGLVGLRCLVLQEGAVQLPQGRGCCRGLDQQQHLQALIAVPHSVAIKKKVSWVAQRLWMLLVTTQPNYWPQKHDSTAPSTTNTCKHCSAQCRD